MLNRTKNINSELEAKFIQDRVTSVERNLAELCQAFGAYSRKAARLRDKGDEISQVALHYSETEDINKSLSNGLAKFANSITTISDYGDKRTQYIDTKVISEFGQYELICKRVKEEVKQIFITRDKEVMRKRQLDRVRERNPRNRQQIVQAETELMQATSEVSKTIHNLEEQVTTFERQKLHDIKAILLDFISTELAFHAKAVEQLTEAYQDIDAVDEDADLEDFKKSLRLPETIPHAGERRSVFRSAHSLGSLGSIFSTPKKKTVGIPSNNGLKSKPRKSKSEDELDKKDKKTGKYNELEYSGESDSQSESEISSSAQSEEKHISPFVAKRYLK